MFRGDMDFLPTMDCIALHSVYTEDSVQDR